MSTLGIYFPMSYVDANALRFRLNALAATHGYIAARGPSAGDGNLAGLLIAIDAGEIATVLLDDDDYPDAISHLESLGEMWSNSIAASLRAAQTRKADADQSEMDDGYTDD